MIKFKYVLFSFLFATTVFAETPEDPPAELDPPVASIEQNLYILCAVAVGFGLITVAKRNQRKSYTK